MDGLMDTLAEMQADISSLSTLSGYMVRGFLSIREHHAELYEEHMALCECLLKSGAAVDLPLFLRAQRSARLFRQLLDEPGVVRAIAKGIGPSAARDFCAASQGCLGGIVGAVVEGMTDGAEAGSVDESALFVSQPLFRHLADWLRSPRLPSAPEAPPSLDTVLVDEDVSRAVARLSGWAAARELGAASRASRGCAPQRSSGSQASFPAARAPAAATPRCPRTSPCPDATADRRPKPKPDLAAASPRAEPARDEQPKPRQSPRDSPRLPAHGPRSARGTAGSCGYSASQDVWQRLALASKLAAHAEPCLPHHVGVASWEGHDAPAAHHAKSRGPASPQAVDFRQPAGSKPLHLGDGGLLPQQDVWQYLALADMLASAMGPQSIKQFRVTSRAGRECMHGRGLPCRMDSLSTRSASSSAASAPADSATPMEAANAQASGEELLQRLRVTRPSRRLGRAARSGHGMREADGLADLARSPSASSSSSSSSSFPTLPEQLLFEEQRRPPAKPWEGLRTAHGRPLRPLRQPDADSGRQAPKARRPEAPPARHGARVRRDGERRRRIDTRMPAPTETGRSVGSASSGGRAMELSSRHLAQDAPVRSAEELMVGLPVVVCGLQTRTQFNGQVGRLVSYRKDAGRWNMVLATGDFIRVHPRNLMPVPDTFRLGASPRKASLAPSDECLEGEQSGLEDACACQSWTILPALKWAYIAGNFAGHAALSHVSLTCRALFEAVAKPAQFYVAGGCDGERALTTVEGFDTTTGEWFTLPAMADQHDSAACAVLGRHLYIIGGTNSRGASACVERFDAAIGSWQVLPEMHYRRSYAAVVVLRGLIYIVGGGVMSHAALPSAECFDPGRRAWQLLPNMFEARACPTALAMDGYIYVVGGSGLAPLSSMERYDTLGETWEMMRPMGKCRFFFAHAKLGEHIYICGGCGGADTLMLDSRASLSSVERYDARSGFWSELSPMREARCGAIAAVTSRSCIHVCGGCRFACGDSLQCTESFDPAVGVWMEGPVMKRQRTFAAGVVAMGHVYICGGNSGGQIVNAVERLDLDDPHWEDAAPMSALRIGATGAASTLKWDRLGA